MGVYGKPPLGEHFWEVITPLDKLSGRVRVACALLYRPLIWAAFAVYWLIKWSQRSIEEGAFWSTFVLVLSLGSVAWAVIYCFIAIAQCDVNHVCN